MVSLTRLDLNLLLILDTVLSEKSVVRAAQRLHVTPSAISNALARLRSIFNDPLVVRKGRGIVPTPRAAEMAPLLKRTMRELEEAIQNEAFDAATTTRQFTLAVSDAGQVTRVPAISQLLSLEMPCAQLRVVGIDTYLNWGGPASTEVDVALAAIDETVPGMHASPLYTEGSVLVARRAHPFMRKRVSKKSLAELEHVDVQVAPGRGYRDLARHYALLGVARRIAVVVPSFVAAAAIVSASDLVSTIPASVMGLLGSPLGLAVLRSPAPTLKTTVRLVWHQRTHADPASRAFRGLVERAIKQSI